MSDSNKRVFGHSKAARVATPAMIGLVGPSGSGKTRSALRIATGLQRVVGGDIWMIDTEAKRGLHHADKFDFTHLPFGAPFSPLDYLAAFEHCIKNGARHIIVDSMSHEHEGPGGVLEMHDQEVERRAEAEAARYGKKRTSWGDEKHNFPAWAEPKAQRRRMINFVLQQECNFVFCFRAKPKIKMVKKKAENGYDKTEMVEQGFQAIAGEEFLYEMLINFLLLPGAQGVPTYTSEYPGERELAKVPEQFLALKNKPEQLSESIGEGIGRWCAGASASVQGKPSANSQAEQRHVAKAQAGKSAEAKLCFGKGYTVTELRNKPLESATEEQIVAYQAYLQAILDDASKGSVHTQVSNHKQQVDDFLDQIRAEEAMGGSGDDEEAA